MVNAEGRNKKEVPIFVTGTSRSYLTFSTTRTSSRSPELPRTA